jgi:riboflavin synthase
MFTGIIELQGTVDALDRNENGGRLRVRAPELAGALAVSGSIAVNGCCLTIVERDAETFAADLSPETIRRTTFAELKTGAPVNLERPLTAGKELGGHFVQGHVDAVGRVVRLAREGAAATPNNDANGESNWWLEIGVPEEVTGYVAEKGSIAVDGIGLTVASWRDGVASFAIIPYTYSHTNVRAFSEGAGVNLEADVLAKYVERLLDARRGLSESRYSLERLVSEGF